VGRRPNPQKAHLWVTTRHLSRPPSAPDVLFLALGFKFQREVYLLFELLATIIPHESSTCAGCNTVTGFSSRSRFCLHVAAAVACRGGRVKVKPKDKHPVEIPVVTGRRHIIAPLTVTPTVRQRTLVSIEIQPTLSNYADVVPKTVQSSSFKSKHYKWLLPTIFLANVRSLFNELDDFEAVLNAINADIACITETMLSDEVPSEAVSMNGYVLFRNDRNRRGGGVACFVKNELPCTCSGYNILRIRVLNHWLLMRTTRMPRWMSHIALGVIYNPPKSDDRAMSNHIISCIDDIRKNHPYAGVVIVGDLNRLRDTPLRAYPLKQIVTGTTRGDAILDKIYTNIAEWYDPPAILPQIGRSSASVALPMALYKYVYDYDYDLTIMQY